MQRFILSIVLSAFYRIVTRNTTAEGSTTMAWSLQCPRCLNEAINFETNDDGETICDSCFAEEEAEYQDEYEPNVSGCDGCFDPNCYFVSCMSWRKAQAEIEDGPYDPSQDCCPCDWNAKCDEHPTKEYAITRDPLFSYMIAEARIILRATEATSAIEDGSIFPRLSDMQRIENRFSMVLTETTPAPCQVQECAYGNPNHGDGFCYRHQDFCSPERTRVMEALHGPTEYLSSCCE